MMSFHNKSKFHSWSQVFITMINFSKKKNCSHNDEFPLKLDFRIRFLTYSTELTIALKIVSTSAPILAELGPTQPQLVIIFDAFSNIS